MPKCLERACGDQVVKYKIKYSHLSRARLRELRLLFLDQDMIFENLKEADRRISKSQKWKNQERAMKTELNYLINLLFESQAMDRDIKIDTPLRDTARRTARICNASQ